MSRAKETLYICKRCEKCQKSCKRTSAVKDADVVYCDNDKNKKK